MLPQQAQKLHAPEAPVPWPDEKTTAAPKERAFDGSLGRILVVEDQESLALGVRDVLTHAGHLVEIVRSGTDALTRVRNKVYDLLVLDLMLPGMSGLDVLQVLRDEGFDVRVLILTALDDETSLLKSFQLGADDYMPKPFSARELIARVEAQFRRAQLQSEHTGRVLPLAPRIFLDLARNEVQRYRETISLTEREGHILSYLKLNSNRVVTRENLLTDVWGYLNPAVRSRTVDIHIVSLRKKIEPDPGRPTLIQTVRGRGYRWGGM